MRHRRGFTLIEIMIAMMLLLVVTGTAVQFLRRQTNAVAREVRRADALQNAEFAATQIERELREAGAGVVDMQPMVVQIDSEAMTFNANLVSIDSGDVRAVYQLTDADPAAVRAMLRSEQRALPNSSPPKAYPESTYMAAKGVESGAETISYWLRPDSSSPYPNRYVVWRQVNARPATLVARDIVKDVRDTVPVFTYYKGAATGPLTAISRTLYPIYHPAVHGAPNDTGPAALTDSVRAVRVHFLAAARDPRTGKDALRTVDVFVRLMNSGLLRRSSCGNKPYTATNVVATSSVPGAEVKTVTVTWTASADDLGGERDLERYAIFRRLDSDPAFADPIASIPSSQKATYDFVDTQVLPGVTYYYGIAAQDCTPSMSDLSATTVPVTVNP